MFIKNICWRYWYLSIALVPLLANGMETDKPSMSSTEKAQWLNFFVKNRAPRDDLENEQKWIGIESITIENPNVTGLKGDVKGVGACEVRFHDLWEHAIYGDDACDMDNLKQFYTRPAIFLCLLKLLKKDIENNSINLATDSELFNQFKKYYQAHLFNIKTFAQSDINIEKFFDKDTVTSVCEKNLFYPEIILNPTEKPYEVFLHIIDEIKEMNELAELLLDGKAAQLKSKSLTVTIEKKPPTTKPTPENRKSFLTRNKMYKLFGGIGILMILYLSHRFLKA